MPSDLATDAPSASRPRSCTRGARRNDRPLRSADRGDPQPLRVTPRTSTRSLIRADTRPAISSARASSTQSTRKYPATIIVATTRGKTPRLLAGSLRLSGGSVPVSPATYGTASRSEDEEHHSDEEQDDPDSPQDRDLQQESQQKQDQSEDEQWSLLRFRTHQGGVVGGTRLRCPPSLNLNPT
jgi:hypothetical protein